MKFLDSDGLKVVLNRIKSTFATKAELSAVEKRIGGGTKVSEFCVKLIDTRYQKTYFFKFKILESADLTHFYAKVKPLDSTNSYKNNDFIKCINEYDLKNFSRKDEYKNITVNYFSINSQGLQFMQSNSDEYYTQPLAENVWVYLGGVPTSEIRQ